MTSHIPCSGGASNLGFSWVLSSLFLEQILFTCSTSSSTNAKIRQTVASTWLLDPSVLTLALSKQSKLEYQWAGAALEKEPWIHSSSRRGKKYLFSDFSPSAFISTSKSQYVSVLMKTSQDDPTLWARGSAVLASCFLCSPLEILRELRPPSLFLSKTSRC